MVVKQECINYIKSIIEKEYNGNISAFCRESNINKSYMSDFLKGKRGIGIVFIKKINDYCEKKNIKKLIFF